MIASGDIQPLIGGEAAFHQIRALIRASRKSISIRMFIWRDDWMGRAMARELLAAARRGVRIAIEKDFLGSIHERSEESCRSFFPHRQGPLLRFVTSTLRKYYFRLVPQARAGEDGALARSLLSHPGVSARFSRCLWDHSKCYVFDDETLVLGGMNVEEKYLLGDRSGLAWRDSMIRIRSRDLVTAFRARQSEWIAVGEQKVRLIFHHGRGHSSRSKNQFELSDLIRQARESLVLEMAYFGDPVLTGELIRAVRRGVRLEIVSSAWANIQAHLNLSVLGQILRESYGAAEVYLSPKRIHTKMMLVDHRLYYVGSRNFNISSRICAETGVLVDWAGNRAAVQHIRASIDQAVRESQRAASPADCRFSRVLSATEWLLSSARF